MSSREPRALNCACLCGAVEFTAGQTAKVCGCYCHLCCRSGGATFYAVGVKDFTLEKKGAAALKVVPNPKWGQCNFCRNCGRSIFFQTKSGAFQAVSLGDLVRAETKIFAAYLHRLCRDRSKPCSGYLERLAASDRVQIIRFAGTNRKTCRRGSTRHGSLHTATMAEVVCLWWYAVFGQGTPR